jgi:K+ transporter
VPPARRLTLAAIGVVYGDIGTSPLYALKEVFAHGRVPLTPRTSWASCRWCSGR